MNVLAPTAPVIDSTPKNTVVYKKKAIKPYGVEAKLFQKSETLTERERNKAQTALYKRFHPQIRGYYVNETHNYRLSDELAQGAMIKVLTGTGTFKEGHSIENWIHGIARNFLIDYYRSNGTHKNKLYRTMSYVENYTLIEPMEEQGEMHESFVFEEIKNILADLEDKRYTDIFTSYFIENETLASLAERMELSVETIKNKTAWLRKHIREQLREEEDDL